MQVEPKKKVQEETKPSETEEEKKSASKSDCDYNGFVSQQQIQNDKSRCDIEIDGIRFWSNFDSGNLKSVSKDPFEEIYSLQLSYDCEYIAPEIKAKHIHSGWFYFKVKSSKSSSLQLKITNLSQSLFQTLYQNGKDVLIKQEGQVQWQSITVTQVEVLKEIKLINISFTVNLELNKSYSICFSYPWSYSHNLKFYNELSQTLSKSKSIYFHKELFTNSLEQRTIEIITVSSYSCIQNDQMEKRVQFPYLFTDTDTPRAFKFTNKNYILITCRVHAGESPSSYVLRGFLNFLQENSYDSAQFLDNFVCVIVPMLNPDGVFHGHYRLNSFGHDLNRCYNMCLEKRQQFPELFGVLSYAKYLDEDSRLFAYFDLHAHAKYSGAFFYGNVHDNASQQINIQLLPKLISLFSKCFEFEKNSAFSIQQSQQIQSSSISTSSNNNSNNSNTSGNGGLNSFSLSQTQQCIHETKRKVQVNVNKKNQQSQSLQQVQCLTGVGKSDVYLTTSICQSYTLEVNYFGYAGTGKQGEKKKKKMKISDLEQIGKSIALGLLEFFELRKISILQTTKYHTLENLREDIRQKILYPAKSEQNQ